MATYNPLTGYEPKLLDDFDYSETSAMIFQDESGDRDTEPSFLSDAELDDDRRKSRVPNLVDKLRSPPRTTSRETFTTIGSTREPTEEPTSDRCGGAEVVVHWVGNNNLTFV